MNNLRNEKLLKAFGAHVKQLRLKKGLTLEALAFACEMELSQVHRIETGKINATLSTLSALSTGLDITMAELLKGV